MKKAATITLITSAALAFAIPLYATGTPGSTTSDSQRSLGVTQEQTDTKKYGQMITADKLKGMEVVSKEGEEIGKINKITIDKDSGEVQFVTLSKGGIFGMGAEEIAIPLSAFEFSDEKAKLTVDQTKLDNAPRQTSGVTDSDYLRDLETHYGVAQGRETRDQGDTNRTRQMDQKSTEAGDRGDTNGTRQMGQDSTEQRTGTQY